MVHVANLVSLFYEQTSKSVGVEKHRYSKGHNTAHSHMEVKTKHDQRSQNYITTHGMQRVSIDSKTLDPWKRQICCCYVTELKTDAF